ncbi:MAG: hypothetical protein HY556_09885 [Euryarchaeota archaeon]|nr:hypothetical protein [Euryarchaeota archaeon]
MAATGTGAKPPNPMIGASGTIRNLTAIMVIAVVVQAFHLVEHFAQVWQHAVQGLPAAASHGILFFLDLEWNHWIFNVAYLVALLIVGWLLRRPGVRQVLRSRPFGATAIPLFAVGVGVQLYHVVEHTVRMYQHLTLGCEPCPGTLAKGGILLGMGGFDGVYLHFAFNMTVALLPALLLIPLRPEASLWLHSTARRLKGRSTADS